MRHVSFCRPDGSASFGRIHEDAVLDLGASGAVPDLKAALASNILLQLPAGPRYALDQVQLLPLIPNPGKLLCVGLNYDTHRREAGRAQAAHPAIFVRFADTLIAHGQPLLRPRVSSQFDYEGELAVVIGRGGRNIIAAQALEHVAGYSCFNDASVRDWQQHNIQFTPGKNFPATAAFGPCLVSPDEVGELGSQHVITRLNGAEVQNQPLRDMIWPVAELIAYISVFTPLAAGDVIATGTPGGVGAKRAPPLWLQPSDRVEVQIDRVGTLANPVGTEAPL